MQVKYFDHAATTAVKEDVLKEMLPYFSMEYGNPSSLYTIGRRNRKIVEESRNKVANAIGALSKEIYFTSCGSEGDNLAIKGVAMANNFKGKHIITSKIEHPAVLNTCKALENQGYEITYLNVDKNGFINLFDLENSIKDTTILITIMFANNEIGTIEPIKQIGEIAKKHNILFHTDAVQAIGNVQIDVNDMNIDLLTMSAHKFYGPKGIGALYVREGVPFTRIQDGGHQEKNKRAGTENVAGIVGIGKAIELIYNDFEKYNTKLTDLRKYYISKIQKKFPNAKLNGDIDDRLPGNANMSFPGIDGESLLLHLDSKGICASSGSACTSGSSEPSHVLTAIGLSKNYAQGSLRVTFGDANTRDDVDYLVESIENGIKKLQD